MNFFLYYQQHLQLESKAPTTKYLLSLIFIVTLSHPKMSSKVRHCAPILPRGQVPRILCEICSRPHDGRYGSGRFCSTRCSRKVGGHAYKKTCEERRKQAPASKSRTKSSTSSKSKMNVSALLN